MRTALTTLILATTFLVSCKKDGTTPVTPNNEINVSATVDAGSVSATSYWRSQAQLNKSLVDSAFIRMQYDIYNNSNVMQYSIVDTVRIAPGAFSSTHLTNKTTSPGWTAKNVTILSVWAKSGTYIFKY